MSQTSRHAPNRQLAWERLQRGWSYEEVAKRIRTEMVRSDEMETGLTANTVRRWESGERRPEPRYRKHLVTIFGKPASELGLLTTTELAQRPIDNAAHEFGRLAEMIADQLGARGIGRATFLRGLLSAVAVPSLLPALSRFDGDAIDRFVRTLAGTTRIDNASVGAYVDVVERSRTLYWASPPATMFDSARAHSELGVQLLRGGGDGRLRQPLASAVAESSLLAARVAFFDLQQPDVAKQLLDVALWASREAGDHALALAVLAHAAFVPGFSGDPGGARSLLRAASAHASHGIGPSTRAWLHCVHAEIEARAGESRSCLHRIRLSEEALTGQGQDPEWLDFFDEGRLDGFAGYCLLIADNHTEAARRLADALHHLPAGEAKQQAVLYADLSAAHLPTDRDQSVAYLHRAIDSLETDWYAVGYARIVEYRRALAGTPEGHEITDRLAAIPNHLTRQALV